MTRLQAKKGQPQDVVEDEAIRQQVRHMRRYKRSTEYGASETGTPLCVYMCT